MEQVLGLKCSAWKDFGLEDYRLCFWERIKSGPVGGHFLRYLQIKSMTPTKLRLSLKVCGGLMDRWVVVVVV